MIFITQCDSPTFWQTCLLHFSNATIKSVLVSNKTWMAFFGLFIVLALFLYYFKDNDFKKIKAFALFFFLVLQKKFN